MYIYQHKLFFYRQVQILTLTNQILFPLQLACMRIQAYMVEMVAGETESYQATLSIHISQSSAHKQKATSAR